MPIDRRDLVLLELVGGAASRLNRAGVGARATSLDLSEDLTAEEWVSIGSRLAALHAAVSWWLADWASAGFADQGEIDLEQAFTKVGLTLRAARSLARVSDGVTRSLRRYRLSFELQAEVREMNSANAKRWLDEAEANGWTRAELHEAIRTSR